MSTEYNLTIIQKDKKIYEITVTDVNGNAFNLTGYTMTFTAKKDIKDTDGNSSIDVDAVISSPTTGIGLITLTPTNTDLDIGSYFYDIKIYTDSANVQTIIDGIITMESTVKKTIP
jgi:hypothetical protein